MQCPWKPKEDTGSSGPEVIGSCDPLDVHAGNGMLGEQYSFLAAEPSPVPCILFLNYRSIHLLKIHQYICLNLCTCLGEGCFLIKSQREIWTTIESGSVQSVQWAGILIRSS